MQPIFVLASLALLASGRVLPRLPDRSLGPAVAIYAAGLWLWIVTLVRRGWVPATSGTRGWTGRDVLVGVGVGIVAFTVGGLGYVLSRRALGLAPPAEARLFTGLDVRLAGGVALVVGAATLEEWIFRGALFEYGRSLPTWLLLGTTSLAFAAYHVDPFQLLPTFLLGLVLGTTVLAAGNVRAAIVAHAFFNLVGLLLAALAPPR